MSKIQSKLSQKRNFKSNSNNSAVSNCIGEDTSNLVAGSVNEIHRWICMMNKSENINLVFLQILKEIEENITARIDIFQKYLVSKLEKEISALRKPQTIFSNANVKELIKEIGVSFPLKDIDSFESFDYDLEDESDKMDALRELLLHQIDGISSLTRDVYKLMKYVATEYVLINYTCSGRKFRGLKKKNFSSTNVYLCMEDVLIHKHKQPSTTLNLVTIFSNYFARINFKNKLVKQ